MRFRRVLSAVFPIMALELCGAFRAAAKEIAFIESDDGPAHYRALDQTAADSALDKARQAKSADTSLAARAAIDQASSLAHEAAVNRRGGATAVALRTAGPTRPPRQIVISTCQEITRPGRYVLASDLEAKGACLSISNVSDVSLSCAGHHIASTNAADGAVVIQNADRVSIDGCSLSSENNGEPGGETSGLFVEGAERLQITNSQIRVANLKDVTGGRVLGTTVSGYYQQENCSQMLIDKDQFYGYSDRVNAAAFASIHGRSNVISNSVFDGGWDGQTSTMRRFGADLGIALSGETHVRIQNNVIQNAWDNGMENTGALADSTLANNEFRNLGNAAIAGAWDNDWTGNQVLNNSADNVPMLFLLQHSHNGYGTPLEGVIVRFEGNLFRGNVLRSRPSFSRNGPGAFFSFENLGSSNEQIDSVVVGSNTFEKNDFGTQDPGPVFHLPVDPINGGGNICAPPPWGASNPLNCSGS